MVEGRGGRWRMVIEGTEVPARRHGVLKDFRAPLPDRLVGVPNVLIADVIHHESQLPRADAAEVVSLCPTKRSPGHEPIAVRDARTGSLESLNQSRRVEHGRELEHDVDVIRDDSARQEPGAVTS